MGISHLEIHTGKTKRIRVKTSNPTDPTPVTGDIYANKTAPSQALAIYGASGWLYLSLQA